MKLKVVLKSGVGLIYTTLLFWLITFVFGWSGGYFLGFSESWIRAVFFWLVGIPIIIGLFQLLATVAAIPVIKLMRGSRWLGWVLLLPCGYFMYIWGYILWQAATIIGTVLGWLVTISWFLETAWLYVAYVITAIGSAYEEDEMAG